MGLFCGILRFLVTAAAVPVCAELMDGVRAVDMSNAVVLGLLLALVYTLLRPLLRLLLKVVNFCTLGLLYVAVDAWLVWTAAALLDWDIKKLWRGPEFYYLFGSSEGYTLLPLRAFQDEEARLRFESLAQEANPDMIFRHFG